MGPKYRAWARGTPEVLEYLGTSVRGPKYSRPHLPPWCSCSLRDALLSRAASDHGFDRVHVSMDILPRRRRRALMSRFLIAQRSKPDVADCVR